MVKSSSKVKLINNKWNVIKVTFAKRLRAHKPWIEKESFCISKEGYPNFGTAIDNFRVKYKLENKTIIKLESITD